MEYTYLILLSNTIMLHQGCFPPSTALLRNIFENDTLKMIQFFRFGVELCCSYFSNKLFVA